MKEIEMNKIDKTDIDEFLKHRHSTIITWGKSIRAIDSDGNETGAFVTSMASVHDCINIQRKIEKLMWSYSGENEEDEKLLLSDFMKGENAIIGSVLATEEEVSEND